MVLPTMQELVGFPFATVATAAKSGDTSPSLSDFRNILGVKVWV